MAAADDANSEGGKPARTLFQVVESYRNRASWLVLLPLTGRTHQLRVHCAALGTPIIGDGKYGGRDAFPEALKSEEHTSELQSLMRISYAVFCLKKKTTLAHIKRINTQRG